MLVVTTPESKPWSPNRFMLAAFAIEIAEAVNMFVIAFSNGESGIEMPSMVIFSMFVLYMTGFGRYAKSKGYSPLLGIVGFFRSGGLIILFLLPDREVVEEGETSNLIVPPPQEIKAAA